MTEDERTGTGEVDLREDEVPPAGREAADGEGWRPEGLAVASDEAVRKGAEAQAVLAAAGKRVWVETYWWGFQVHMEPGAAENVADIQDLIADIVEAAVPKVGRLVAAIVKLHAAAIRYVNTLGSLGVKCTSPWIAPGWLIPTPRTIREDLNMWWTVLDTTRSGSWSQDEKFPAHESADNPALAVLDGRLVCVHRGGKDSRLWYATYDPATGWSEDTAIDQRSTDGPALAVYNGRIHCVFKAHVGNVLYHATFDGTRWSPGVPMPGHHTSQGPALATFGGKLHLVHRAANGNQMWHATYDGTRWSQDQQMPGHQTASNPALCSFHGQLHLVHRGGNDTSLWHATWDGANGWSPDRKFAAHQSLEGPALAVYRGELHCVHRGAGNGDQNLWGTKLAPGKAWTPDAKFPDHLSGAGPALAVYRDANGLADQLLCVHRGWGRKAAGVDTAEVEARIAAEQQDPNWITTPEADQPTP
jgi:hypothetical protein